MSGNIKVVVRCRPLNAREKARGASCIIRMEGKQTIITNPKKSSSVSHQRSKHQKEEEDNIKAFTFDRSYWSVDKSDPRYASQELVYNDLGRELLDHAFDGYNCCIFAYGQTGSGKSYSMMGYGEDKGIIPRTCSELFERISYLTDDTLKFQVEVSFIEIYNEKVRDLLNPGNKGNLKARTVAATNMNETSSRSHAVFTIFLTSSRFDSVANLTTEKASRISLVDLAGSERANSTGATGVRLKEGANINKSLTTLGKVIAALAEQSSQQSQLARRPSTVNSNAFIPYRDSVLTWLLKDSLGGNSKTAMVAAISPADYDETLSTLRYADQAKRIKNKPIVNEDPNARLIRELKEELQALRDTLMIYAPEEVEKITQNKKSGSRPGSSRALSRARAASTASPMLLLSPESPIATKRGNSLLTKEQVIDQLQSSEKLLLEVKQTWEERMRKTEEIHREREKALEELGVIVEKDNVGVYAPRSIHLINLNEDPLMTECLMYHIKPGVTRVGRLGSDIHADIRLSGPEIMDEHCYFENVPSSTTTAAAAVEDIDSVDENYHNANIVTIYPGKDSVTLVNGTKIIQPKVLHSGYRIIFGSGLHHLFRFNNPDEVRRERKHMQLQAINPMMSGAFQSSNVPDIVDWSFAHNEALRKFGSAEGRADLAALTDEDLKQLSEGITKMPDELNKEKEELASKYAQIKEEMEKTLEEQKITYESKIKRISAHLPPGTALSSDNLLVGYTSKNAAEILMRITIDKWRQLRYVKMAEDCLIHAVSLKEANIMAKELGKNVVYQFIVVHDDISANPLSFWESTSALQPFTKEPDTHLMKEAKPCLAVQVIDHVHRATYIWSILKLKQRLKRMRRLYDYTDGPLFTSQHFNREDPFYETLCPRFSLIGLARVPLQNLTLQLHADNYVDVYCRNTGKVMGQVRVLITPIAPTLNSLAQKDQQQHALGEKYLLHIGQQQVFEIRIQECIGVPESDFTQIHAQFRLSSFGNVERYSAADKVYQTDPISNFGEGSVMFNQCQTLSINITENMMDVILNQGLTIEVYGQAREKLLLGLVEHAVSEEDKKSGHASVNRRFSLDSRYSIEHKTYDGILMKERHDILAWIQLCELNSDGEYTPVRVIRSEVNDPHHHIKQHQDVFCLRQGLQRRISLTLTHDSGKQFEWYKIKEINISHVRLMDNKGKVIESPHHPPVEIRLFTEQTKTTFERNGISRIAVQGSWDSSLHDSVFLNRITATGQYIRLTMSWKVSTEKCTAPLQFHMDIAVLIHGRDSTMYTPSSSSSMLFRQFLLGGSDSAGSNANKKVVRKASGMFTVQLKPPLTRHVRELWRLNTSNKYVRGEEFIGSWKPRGVLLITEYREARRRMLHRETVAAFRHSLIMAGHPQTKVIQENQAKNLFSSPIEQQAVEAPHEESPEGLTRKVIDLWKSRFGTQEDVRIMPIREGNVKCFNEYVRV
ncbi:MAG: hypothetical protein EXX96DRAFT_482414 [Benjaminiella poitrasii]|nr:MAG: hypothetical protein EXX96DRAFT_482414 [Benjaminiella poitrasii]